LKRTLCALAAAVFVGCPVDTPQDGCTSNDDCSGVEICAAGQCVNAEGEGDVVVGEGEGDEGEGDVGEGEGDVGEGEGDAGEGEGEGEGGEGEGEPPPPPTFALEAELVPSPGVLRAGSFTVTGGTVLFAPRAVARGQRFTLRLTGGGQ